MRALVLSGGGSKGAYHVGAVRALVERGAEYDIFCGTSVGAINAAGLAQYPTLAEGLAAIAEVWRTTETRHVARKRLLAPLCLLWAPSIYTVDPMRTLLYAHVDLGRLRETGKRLRVLTTALEDGCAHVHESWDTTADLVESIVASSVAPIIYPPSRILGRHHVDGGIRDTSPLAAAIAAGATEIDLVLCESRTLSPWAGEPKTGLAYAGRVLEIMLSEIIEGDIRATCLHSELKRRDPTYSKRDVRLRVCRPADPLGVDSTVFDPSVSARLVLRGYIDASVRFH